MNVADGEPAGVAKKQGLPYLSKCCNSTVGVCAGLEYRGEASGVVQFKGTRRFPTLNDPNYGKSELLFIPHKFTIVSSAP